jgi:hypothetical protein
VALGENVQQLGAPLCGALDLEPDVIQCLGHTCKNEELVRTNPGR